MKPPSRPLGRLAQGHRMPDRTRLLVTCVFDDETFAAIRERAVAQRSSVAATIRELVEWGLEAEARP